MKMSIEVLEDKTGEISQKAEHTKKGGGFKKWKRGEKNQKIRGQVHKFNIQYKNSPRNTTEKMRENYFKNI